MLVPSLVLALPFAIETGGDHDLACGTTKR
jgi:hypothetical protein